MEQHSDTIVVRLQRIEDLLADIECNTHNTWHHAVFYSALRGAGFLLGTVLAIAIAGWILSYLGVIPGIGDIAHHLRDIIQARSSTR